MDCDKAQAWSVRLFLGGGGGVFCKPRWFFPLGSVRSVCAAICRMWDGFLSGRCKRGVLRARAFPRTSTYEFLFLFHWEGVDWVGWWWCKYCGERKGGEGERWWTWIEKVHRGLYELILWQYRYRAGIVYVLDSGMGWIFCSTIWCQKRKEGFNVHSHGVIFCSKEWIYPMNNTSASALVSILSLTCSRWWTARMSKLDLISVMIWCCGRVLVGSGCVTVATSASWLHCFMRQIGTSFLAKHSYSPSSSSSHFIQLKNRIIQSFPVNQSFNLSIANIHSLLHTTRPNRLTAYVSATNSSWRCEE